MAGRIMELALAIKGRLDGSVTSSMQRAISESRQLQSQIRQANQAMRDAQRAADAEQRATGRVSTAQYQRIAELQARINSLTQRRSDILDAQAAKEQAGARFSHSAGKLGTGIAMTAAAAAPLAAMIGTAANFEQAMSKVKAITNSSNEDMERLTATAQDLGSKTQFSASQAAEAMSYLGMAGWKTEQIISGMPGLLDLAAASGSSLATVADIVSDDLTAFGMSADQAGHMADVMAAASTNANTNVEMMGQTFKYAGAVAGAMGYSLEDVAVATGLMANAGIKADQAGTSLRSIMTRLAAPTKESGNAMDQLGISVVNADGTMKPFMTTMKDLRAAFAGLSEAEKAEKAKMIAGQEAMSGLLAVVNASDEDFAKLSNSIMDCDGAAAKMAGTMNDNAKGGAIQLQSAIEGVSIAIGQIFLPTLAQIAGGLASAVGGVAKWAGENRALVSTIIVAAGAVTGLILAVLAINTAVAGINYLRASMELYKVVVTESTIVTKLWAGVTKVAAAAQAAFNAVMAANPIALVVLAIAALVAAMVYLFNTNQEFHDTVIAAWEEIKSAAMEVWNAIAPIVMAAWEGIKAAAQAGIEFLKGLWADIGPSVMSAFGKIVPILSWVVGVAKTLIVAGLAFWATYIRTMITVIGGIIRGIVSVVTAVWSTLTAIWSAGSNAVTAITETLGAVFGGIWNGLTAGVSAAWSIITSIVSAGVSTAESIMQTLVSVGTSVMEGITQALEPITSAISYVFDEASAAVIPVINEIVNTVSSVVSTIRETLSSLWGGAGSSAESAWDGVKNAVSGAIDYIRSLVQGIAPVLNAIWGGLSAAASAAWSVITGIVSGAVAAIGAVIRFLTPIFTTVWSIIVGVVSVYWTIISTVIKTAINVIAAIIRALVPIFSAVWSVIKVAAKVAFIAMAVVALPVIAAIGVAVVAMGAVIYAVWQAVKLAASVAWAVISTVVQAAMAIIVPVVQAAGVVLAAVWSFIQDTAIMVWNTITMAIETALTIIMPIVEVAGAVISEVWNAIMAVAIMVWDTISATVGAVASAIGSFIAEAAAVIMACWNSIQATAEACWDAIVSTVQSVWDTVQGIVDAGVEAVTAKWEQLKSIFSSPIQAVVNFVRGGDSGAASASGVDISANAAGGIYRRGAFLTTFAEEGPEAAIPLDGSARAISLWRQAGQIMGLMPNGVMGQAAGMTSLMQQAGNSLRTPASAIPAPSANINKSNSITVDFNPTINVTGGGGADVKAMIMAALAEQKAQFERELPGMLARVKAGQRRLSYE